MNNNAPTAEPKAYADGVPVYCAHDAIVKVSELKPNPLNPNKHPDEQIQLLGRVIVEHNGWRAPITVSTRSGLIVKGHGRLQAARLEGLKAVPVDYQSYATEEAEYADLVADNRIAELAEIDRKMLADIFEKVDTGVLDVEATGYTEEEVENIVTALSEAIHADTEKASEDLPEEQPESNNAITQPGDLWLCGGYFLFCGDGKSISSVVSPEKCDEIVREYIRNTERTDIRLIRGGREIDRVIYERIFDE